MSDTAPATEAVTGLSFLENIGALPMPRNWQLHAWDTLAIEASDDPQVLASLPILDGDSIARHLAKAGATRGRWRVALAPTVQGPKARHRLDRLQRKGSVSDFVDVTAEDVAAAARQREGAAPAAKRLEPRPPDVSSSVRAAREAAEVQKAENEKLAAEVEREHLLSRLQAAKNAGKHPPEAGGSGLAGMLAPYLPVGVEIVRGFLDNQRKQTEALMAAVTSREPAVVAPPAAGSGLTLEALLSLVPQVAQLKKLFGGLLGSREDRDEEPKSETVRMMEAARDMLFGIRDAVPAAPSAAPAMVPVEKPRPQPSPQQMMNLRVTKWMGAVLSEQMAQADPSYAAEKLFPAIGALPADFRALLLTSQNVEALLTGLPKWLPGAMKTQAPNAIRNDAKRREWLEQFLLTVRGIADSVASQGEDDGDVGQAG